MGANWWRVIFNEGQDDEREETVWYTCDCDAEYIRKSLIDHDGYPNNIKVEKVNT